jgi:DHA2 family methylenomycin A resistance protein-like MFS transporter
MFAALLLSAGALSDRAGARRAFAIGLSVFAVASAACGLAPDLGAAARSPRRPAPCWAGC